MKNTSTTHDEAKHLAEEAVDELRQGHLDEARFVVQEAKSLDPRAVREVLDTDAAAKAKLDR